MPLWIGEFFVGMTAKMSREKGECMRVAVYHKDQEKYYYVYPSQAAVRRYNNDALISRGWTVGEDLPKAAFQRMKKEEISQEVWTHAGCLSACTLRGAPVCRW